MLRRISAARLFCAGVLTLVLSSAAILAGRAERGGADSESEPARQILRATGFGGGLIVHLGCDDGRLTAELHAGPGCVVHGLDTDAGNVRLAREHVARRGLYGPVSVERFDGKRLPYAENMVNLLVAEDLAGLERDEALRVLAPAGVLYVHEGGAWQKIVKPRPGNIDEWTHYAYDASGNPVAHDEAVGPPGRLQWTEGPRHARSHEHLPSLWALVSSGGRIFYIVDEAPTASLRFAPRWRLVARDAFNGILLWKRDLDAWFPHLSGWTHAPNQLQRRLVAVGDRVYVTLGLHAPLAELDAATGKTLRVFQGTRGAEEALWHQGKLLLVVQEVTDQRAAEITRWKHLVAEETSPLHTRDTNRPLVDQLKKIEASGAKSLVVLEANSGRLLWNSPLENLKPESLAASDDRVFYQLGPEVVCADLAAGREQWRFTGPLRVVSGQRVYCATSETVKVLSAENGRELWSRDTGFCQIVDTFVAGGSLWVGGFKPYQGKKTGKRGPAWGPYYASQFSLDTGALLKQVEPENPGHHHRCYRNKATNRYILGGRRGTEFLDMASGEVLWNSWARGVCRYGVMPSNGLLYVPPHACGCYVTAKLTGFNALAARTAADTQPRDVAPQARLERGPACAVPGPGSFVLQPSDWSTYRCDAARSGFTRARVPATLRLRWQTRIGGRTTAPTAGGGKVFLASVDQHTVQALDAGTGQCAWRFTAGGRVDSPPTLHQDRALFGCRDGFVYSLRAEDGALAWRLRAARQDRRVVADGQIESVWPVHGSVLVQEDAVYLTAGRSSYLDGGIDLCRVEPAGGKLLSTTPIFSPDPQNGRQPPHLAPAVMVGARSDLLSSSDGFVYLRDQVFDLRARAQPEGRPHLLTLIDYLDGSWPHRSYWIFGTHASLATGCSAREKNLVYGRLLVFDGSTIYGYGRATVHWSDQFDDGPYRLFARGRGGDMLRWEKRLPLEVRAMVLADRVLFVAGAMVEPIARPDQPRPTRLMAFSADDGTELAQFPLAAAPVFDGMAAAPGRLYVALEDGQLACLEGTSGHGLEAMR